MGKIDASNQFVADGGSLCDAWNDGDVLCICIGDEVLRLEGDEELEQFIHYICETKLREIPV